MATGRRYQGRRESDQQRHGDSATPHLPNKGVGKDRYMRDDSDEWITAESQKRASAWRGRHRGVLCGGMLSWHPETRCSLAAATGSLLLGYDTGDHDLSCLQVQRIPNRAGVSLCIH